MSMSPTPQPRPRPRGAGLVPEPNGSSAWLATRDPQSAGSHLLGYQQPGAADAHALYGTPDQVADGLAELHAGGVSYVLLILETDVAQLRRFRTEVIPRLTP